MCSNFFSKNNFTTHFTNRRLRTINRTECRQGLSTVNKLRALFQHCSCTDGNAESSPSSSSKPVPGRAGVRPCALPESPRTGGCNDFKGAVVLFHGNNQCTMQPCLSKGLRWHLGPPDKRCWAWGRERSRWAWQDHPPEKRNHFCLLKTGKIRPPNLLASPLSATDTFWNPT